MKQDLSHKELFLVEKLAAISEKENLYGTEDELLKKIKNKENKNNFV